MKGELNDSINQTAASAANNTRKKRPTKEVYVPKGRRSLVEPIAKNLEENKEEDLLVDSSIVGYLKNSPEKMKPEDLLDKQMMLMSLNENNKENVDSSVNNSHVDVVDSWDSLYDESGECKNQKFINEVSF
jgi:hypothetical protein